MIKKSKVIDKELAAINTAIDESNGAMESLDRRLAATASSCGG
jgi:hypothetical protein